MTVYQFRLFDAYAPGYPLLGVVSADDEQVVTAWAAIAPAELTTSLDANFAMKLTRREGTEYADQPPTEILRYNLPFLSTANTEFPDFDAARTSAEQIVAENQSGEDYESEGEQS